MRYCRKFVSLVASLIVALVALMGLSLGLSWADNGGSLERITNGSADRDSLRTAISGDGTKIALLSNADFLGQGIPNNQFEIWLYDTATMTLTRITMAPGPGNTNSRGPATNSDGTKVVFFSSADFLGQTIENDQDEIWLYDTATMTLTRITTAAGSERRDSVTPDINGDGTKIVFSSDADFLGQGIAENQREIWLYDTTTMTLTRVTTKSGTGSRSVDLPKISNDGTRIVFYSDADFLGQGIPDNQSEIWLYDTTTMTLTRVTNSSVGRDSRAPAISGDGTQIVFESDADFFGQGIAENQREIWLYDTTAMTLTRITTGLDGRVSRNPVINEDGTKIAFDSNVDFLGEGIPSTWTEIWLYDTATMTLTRVTTGTDASRASFIPTISDNGTRIAFTSNADFLGQGIPENQNEIWLYSDLPDLRLSKTVNATSVGPGEPLTYTLVATNTGGLATGAVFSDTLPDNVTFVGPLSLTPAQPGATLATSAADLPILAQGVTISPAMVVTLTIPVVVSTSVVSGTRITNTATLSSAEIRTPVSAQATVSVFALTTYLPAILSD